MIRAHLFISGLVQGVFYRLTCHREASALRLEGWVRNLSDGRVEAMAQGPKEKVDEWIGWCQRGPSKAQVSKVEVKVLDPSEDLSPFKIR